MENKRTHINIDSDFNQAHGIAASISDLLTIPQGDFELADDTIPKDGFACYKAVRRVRYTHQLDHGAWNAPQPTPANLTSTSSYQQNNPFRHCITNVRKIRFKYPF